MSNSYATPTNSFGKLFRPFTDIGNSCDVKTGLFIEVAEKLIAEQENKGCKFTIFPVKNTNLLYSVIVFVDTRVVKGVDIHLYTSLILGSAVRRSNPVTEVKWPDGRATSTIPVTPDDFYHTDKAKSYLTDVIVTELRSRLGVSDVNHLRSCGDFAIQDIPDQSESYRDRSFVASWLQVLSNATTSTYISILKDAKLLEGNVEDYFFNCKLLKGNPSVLVSYNGQSITGFSGNPVRKDLTITFSNSVPAPGASTFVSDLAKTIVSVSGYIDTSWHPTNVPGTGGNRYLSQFANRNQGVTVYEPPYDALAIITHFDNRTGSDGDVPPTIETMLSGIIAFSIVHEPSVWQRTYDPTYIGKDTPYNIGATTIESGLNINPNEELDFHDYIDAVYSKSPAIAIDIERNGSNYWALAPFTKGREGERLILEACNNFFVGIDFNNYWDTTKPIVVSKYTLQGGFYATGKEYRDIREIDDYIYALTLLGTDPTGRRTEREDFETLIDSLTDGWRGFNLQQRLVTRYRILNALANNSFTPTTLIERVVINPLFIEALVRATADVGIYIDVANRQIENGTNVRRGLNINNYTYSNNGTNIFVGNQRNIFSSY